MDLLSQITAPVFAMRRLQGRIEGPFSVEENSSLHGMITGNVVVRKGVMFFAHGLIIGDLTVEPDAEVTVHGMVDGTIRNYGQVILYGTIDALVDCGTECQSVIHKGALLRNGPSLL